MLAIYSSGIYIGAGIGLFLGGAIVSTWNGWYPGGAGAPLGIKAWQAAFLAVGLPGLLIAANDQQGEFVMRQFPAERISIDIGDYYADDHLIRDTLGWKPKVTLPQGLARSLAYYRDHLDRYV